MEGLSVSVYKVAKGYCRRRRYEKLNGPTRRRKITVELGRAGGGSNMRRRFWKIKISPKLRRLSPKKFLKDLHDAYVNFMERVVNKSPAISSGVVEGTIAYRRASSVKEYDKKMISQIYNSLVVAQGHMVPRDVASIGNRII